MEFKHSVLIKDLQRLGGTVYGGYLRDSVAGDRPNDIDVYFVSPVGRNIIDSLESMGYLVNDISGTDKPFTSSQTTRKRCIQVRYGGGLSINVDLVYSRGRELIGDFLNKQGDADVNCLYLDKVSGKMFVPTGMSVDAVLDNIKSKRYQAFNLGMERRAYLENKGYRSLGLFEIKAQTEKELILKPVVATISTAKENQIIVEKKEKEMVKEEKKSAKERFLDNAETAAYQAAGLEAAALAKSTLLAIIAEDGDAGLVEAARKLLESKWGEPLIAVAAGTVIPLIPEIGEDERAIKIADGMQIGGMAPVMRFGFHSVLDRMVGPMQAILDRLPKKKETKKVRVPDTENLGAAIASNSGDEASDEEAANGNAKPSIAVNRRS